MAGHYHKEFLMEPAHLSEIGEEYGLTLDGPNREIRAMGMLHHRSRHRNKQLTFAITPMYVEQFVASDIAACVVPENLRHLIPRDRSVLLTPDDPEEAFYTLFADTVEHGRWPTVEHYVGAGNKIAASAQIHEPVRIGDDCLIMDNVVILPNSCLGNGVIVKPNSTIGSNGWEARTIRNHRRVPPHCGGVLIEDGCHIGAGNCIDKGLFGDFTYLGAETLMDNLVHIGHSCTLGPRCKITACVEVSGNVVMGTNVWLGPNTSIINHVEIGDNCFVGIASNVVEPLPANALAYGNPARIRGWVCDCREKLQFDENKARCHRCLKEFQLKGTQLERL